MATEIVEKKKHDQEQVVEGKSKGLPQQQLVTFILKTPSLYLYV